MLRKIAKRSDYMNRVSLQACMRAAAVVVWFAHVRYVVTCAQYCVAEVLRVHNTFKCVGYVPLVTCLGFHNSLIVPCCAQIENSSFASIAVFEGFLDRQVGSLKAGCNVVSILSQICYPGLVHGLVRVVHAYVHWQVTACRAPRNCMRTGESSELARFA